MQLNFSIDSNPVISDYLILEAYATADPNTLVGAPLVFPPPQINPRDVSMFVPTPRVHRVDIYESPDGVIKSSLVTSFIFVPKLDSPGFIDPVDIVVDRGRTDTDGNVIDPVDGADFIKIPAIVGYDIAYVEQRGAGVLVNDPTDPGDEWAPYTEGGIYVGGIQLQDGKVFNSGERYTIFFKPFYDTSIAITINDLTALITDHIADTGNPHATTKNQVGLGNIPNAISDSTGLNDSGTLATSKAVYDLSQIVDNLSGLIKYQGTTSAFPVAAQSNQLVTVAHNQHLTSYIVIGTLEGNSVNHVSDNHVTFVTREYAADSFKISVANPSNSNANLTFNYILI